MKEITKEVYLKWYEDMLFWRKFEDKLAAVYIQQKVRGFLHLYKRAGSRFGRFSPRHGTGKRPNDHRLQKPRSADWNGSGSSKGHGGIIW